jgi:hypothetical protein
MGCWAGVAVRKGLAMSGIRVCVAIAVTMKLLRLPQHSSVNCFARNSSNSGGTSSTISGPADERLVQQSLTNGGCGLRGSARVCENMEGCRKNLDLLQESLPMPFSIRPSDFSILIEWLDG